MQIYEHEIPSGSRLYFGKSAKIKRRIERLASELLEEKGFSEIITPFFSYHQRFGLKEQKLLRLSDENNNEVSLRGDSTIDFFLGISNLNNLLSFCRNSNYQILILQLVYIRNYYFYIQCINHLSSQFYLLYFVIILSAHSVL